jgi:signal transduction histidine kinase
VNSLRFRLTFWFAVAVTLTAAAALTIGYIVVRKQMYDGLDFILEAEVQEVLPRLGDHPERLSDEEVRELLQRHVEIDAPLFFFQIHRIGHGVIFRSPNLGNAVLPDLSDGGPKTRTVMLHGEEARQLEVYRDDFHIQVATSLGQMESLLDRYRGMFWISLPIVFVFSLLTGLLLSAAALRPIGAMQRSARRITATNLSERLPVPRGQDEIADLARLLNELFARLETSFDQIKRFTADASHELKTPLSLLRLSAERLIQSEKLSDADRAQAESQIEEIARLNKLVESLLLLARADAKNLKLETVRENPAAYIDGFREDATVLAEDQNLKFLVTQNDPGEAVFDPGLIRRVLLNILSNALNHTPKGGTITLASRIIGHQWEVRLDNDGENFPEQKLGMIFERFVRFENSTGPGSTFTGSGLGLAIARSIVEAHGGTIAAENRAGGGLSLVIRLPNARPRGV